jgi:hypothetical protein
MHNNGFPIPTLRTPTPKQSNLTTFQKTDPAKKIWTPFTYFGRETTFLTIIFKKTDFRITLRTNNSLLNLLTTKFHPPDKYTKSGAYKLTCPDCKKAYVSQTDRNFTQGFKEHRDAFKFNRNNSNYAKCPNTCTLVRTHPQNHANTAVPKQRSPPQHYREILHLQRVLRK